MRLGDTSRDNNDAMSVVDRELRDAVRKQIRRIHNNCEHAPFADQNDDDVAFVEHERPKVDSRSHLMKVSLISSPVKALATTTLSLVARY
jgi:hypothetical protein